MNDDYVNGTSYSLIFNLMNENFILDPSDLERTRRGGNRANQGGRGQQEKDPSEEARREFESRPF